MHKIFCKDLAKKSLVETLPTKLILYRDLVRSRDLAHRSSKEILNRHFTADLLQGDLPGRDLMWRSPVSYRSLVKRA